MGDDSPAPTGFDVVGVFAHPDDEAYSAAALLMLCADAGARVAIVCATDGEGGGDPAVRRQELDESCRIIGATPVRLGWPDGGVDAGDDEARTAELRALLMAWSPAAVVTLALDGGYGHRDHVALTRFVGDACQDGVRLLHTHFEPGVFRPVWRKLRRVAGDRIAGDLAEGDIGLAPAQADLVVDVAPVRARKRACIAAHDSQSPAATGMPFFTAARVEAFCRHELFTVERGPALASDSPLAVLT